MYCKAHLDIYVQNSDIFYLTRLRVIDLEIGLILFSVDTTKPLEHCKNQKDNFSNL